MKLQVMICTIRAEGLQRVASGTLPRVADVGYLISCQSEALPLPESLAREDITVVFTGSVGLGNNRNNALDHVSAPYALIADDDLTFYPDGLRDIIRRFDDDPELDIATFMCDFPYAKVYPEGEHDLNDKCKDYHVTSFEMAVRVDSIRRHKRRFSPLTGIGAPYLQSGEESFFLMSCLKKGLKGRFFPTVIARHPAATTGIRDRSKPGVLRAIGAHAALHHPLTFTLRLPLIARRASGSTLSNLYYLCQGVMYGIRHSKQLLNPTI